MGSWDQLRSGRLSRGQGSGLLQSQQESNEEISSRKWLHEMCFVKKPLAAVGGKYWKGRDGRRADRLEGSNPGSEWQGSLSEQFRGGTRWLVAGDLPSPRARCTSAGSAPSSGPILCENCELYCKERGPWGQLPLENPPKHPVLSHPCKALAVMPDRACPRHCRDRPVSHPSGGVVGISLGASHVRRNTRPYRK